MKIRVAYVDSERQFWEQLDVAEDCTVQRAIEIASPHAVDVSSGVESAPGRKDPAKVREFIRRAKENAT